MTSTVTAQLKDGLDAVDVIRQIFPCGSITGAPKIRAMEIIEELELAEGGSGPRGIYCGSIGRIDAPDEKGRSDAAFNVAIRTFHLGQDKETLSIGLGSGIVADSNGDDEWRECLAKGRFAKVDVNAGGNTGGGHKVDLIETMAFEPASGIARLEAHLERMKTSASTLQFEFDRHAARNAIQAITFHQDSAAMVRLHLGQSGALAIELKPMPKPQDGPVRCQLVPMQAEAADFRLHHKTSDRRVYEADGLADGVHPIFVDGDGYVTEGKIWNIFVERDGKLLTPPLARGVLPGVLREELLESGQAVEADLRAEDRGIKCQRMSGKGHFCAKSEVCLIDIAGNDIILYLFERRVISLARHQRFEPAQPGAVAVRQRFHHIIRADLFVIVEYAKPCQRRRQVRRHFVPQPLLQSQPRFIGEIAGNMPPRRSRPRQSGKTCFQFFHCIGPDNRHRIPVKPRRSGTCGSRIIEQNKRTISRKHGPL